MNESQRRNPARERRTDAGARRSGNNSATFLALFVIMFLLLGLLGLTAMVMPALIALPGILFGFAAFIGMHYMLWGAWMSSAGDPLADEEDDRG